MKKAINEQYGDVDQIKIIETEIPRISNGEVLVKVAAAGLNPKDILVRKGKFKRFTGNKFPQGIGYDFAGTVEDPKNSHFQKGDKVFGMVNGWSLLPSDSVLRKFLMTTLAINCFQVLLLLARSHNLCQ